MVPSLVAPPTPVVPGLTASEAPLEVMVTVFVLFVAAKLGEEFARRLGQPAVIGELLGGFIVGPGVLGLVVPGETALVLAELGVVILLFAVGLEVRTDALLAVGRPAFLTAIIAMILPIMAGIAIGLAIGEPISTATFIGLALAATSIGITSRVLADLGVLATRGPETTSPTSSTSAAISPTTADTPSRSTPPPSPRGASGWGRR